ncbi:UNVERIFIED_CONTAM: hypothetical protein GTU68_002607 [Idotea baltica]|nr:hypothetical protein [Idotea baltica]
MNARPLVGVHEDGVVTSVTVSLPAIFRAPIRPDVVNFVHDQMAKNRRQPYAVSKEAGHQTSAESWGTGRAVARIPRVRGGGTHRSGQGAFGNMCRGGRMFAPTRVWRRWHRRINVTQKRYAMVSAIAATGSPALVMSKGHMISEIPEVPLVVGDKVQELTKTKNAMIFLRKCRAWTDILKVYKSKRFRAGIGKMRNRRRVQRKGPLIVYDKDQGLVKAFRNIPGVDTLPVEHLNVLKLAPGGHVGRFVIWTESAFRKLDQIYGTWRKPSTLKKKYNLPWPKMSNTDLTRILHCEEIQNVIKAPNRLVIRKKRKLNPLKNEKIMGKLNPYALVQKKAARNNQKLSIVRKQLAYKQKKGLVPKVEIKKSDKTKKIRKKPTSRKPSKHLKPVKTPKELLAAKKAKAEKAVLKEGEKPKKSFRKYAVQKQAKLDQIAKESRKASAVANKKRILNKNKRVLKKAAAEKAEAKTAEKAAEVSKKKYRQESTARSLAKSKMISMAKKAKKEGIKGKALKRVMKIKAKAPKADKEAKAKAPAKAVKKTKPQAKPKAKAQAKPKAKTAATKAKTAAPKAKTAAKK